MNFGDFIKQERKIRGWSQEKLAQKSGLTRTAINTIEQRSSNRPSHEAVVRLAKAFNIPESELFPIEGVTDIEKPNENVEDLLDRIRLAQPIQIPVYQDFRLHMGEEHTTPVEYVYLPRTSKAPKNIAAFRVTGECMEPKIENGDIVIVDSASVAESGDLVICQCEDEVICGRLKDKNGELWLQNNVEHCKINDCTRVAVITQIIKKVK